MPFRSEAQRRFMWAKHPAIARRWSAEYGSGIKPSYQDSRGTTGEMARGKTIYSGGSTAAHRGGGPQFGRPVGAKDKMKSSAVRRRIAARNRKK